MFLLLGASGYVGNKFQHWMAKRDLPFRAISRSDCNIYDPLALSQCIDTTQATFLINCAGYTGKPNVDACELHKTECLLANAVLPGIIDQACQRSDIRWGHVSSGCIFTGKGDRAHGFIETDEPNFSFRTNNCSYYSGTKALGEEILQDSDRAYVWRLRVPFDSVDSGRNYLSKLIRYEWLLEATNSLSQLDDFVNACLDCWHKELPLGVYNMTNSGYIDTREAVELILPIVPPGHRFQYFASEADFMSRAAKTPRSNCVLDNTKAIDAGLQLPDVHEAILRSVHAWKREERT
jgi:dTDP-4-dehydrorhamnose reductase